MALRPGTTPRRLLLFLVPRIYLFLERLLFAFCRLEEHGRRHRQEAEARTGAPFIAAFWHYSLFHILHHGRKRGGVRGSFVAMVSGSKDGDLVARLMETLGMVPVRGSRGKGGLAALREMSAQMARGHDAAIVADGSQGPARKVQAGVILLASRTGAPILPVAVSASRFFTFASWDRTMLPLPGSRLALVYGEPLRVPRQLAAGDLEHWRLALEGQLNELYDRAWDLFGRKEHSNC